MTAKMPLRMGEANQEGNLDLIPFNSVCTLMDESETDDTSMQLWVVDTGMPSCRDKKPDLSRKESGHHTHK